MINDDDSFFYIGFYLLSQVVRVIPLGVTYAIWSGVSIVLTAISIYFSLGHKLYLPALIGMALIIMAVAIIHIYSSVHQV
nr:SMR family transporter [Moraxella sp.]